MRSMDNIYKLCNISNDSYQRQAISFCNTPSVDHVYKSPGELHILYMAKADGFLHGPILLIRVCP